MVPPRRRGTSARLGTATEGVDVMVGGMAKLMQVTGRATFGAALACAAWLAAMPAAEAQTKTFPVNIGGKPIMLVIDPDQCLLDRNNPSDVRVWQLVERAIAGQNELLLAAADCQQIPPWRAGARPTLDDFTQAQVNLSLRQQDFTGQEASLPRAICTQLRTQGDAIATGQQMQQMRDRFNQSTETVRLNETTFIGVVHEDDQACYASLVQKVKTDQGKDKLILSVFAHVVLKGRLLYLYRYTEGQKFDDMVRLLELLKVSVAAHLEANR